MFIYWLVTMSDLFRVGFCVKVIGYVGDLLVGWRFRGILFLWDYIREVWGVVGRLFYLYRFKLRWFRFLLVIDGRLWGSGGGIYFYLMVCFRIIRFIFL